MNKSWFLGLVLFFCFATAPTNAQSQEVLKVKAGKAWKHSHSQIEVPAILGGLPRSGAQAYETDQLDVSLNFTVADNGEALTIYIYRKTNGAAPVWFAQAQWAIENRPVYGKATLHTGPLPFSPPRQTTTAGLTAAYSLENGPYRSTGLMLFPVGEWYVKVRASSKARSAEDLALWMEGALKEISWPGKIAPAQVAVPVTACAVPLTFAEPAKDAPKNGAADLMMALLGRAVADGSLKEDDKTEEPVAESWCKDSQVAPGQAIYRRNEASDSYLYAIGDNGNGIWVAPDAMAKLLDKKEADEPASPRFSITRYTATKQTNYVAQDRLPSPMQVAEIVNAGRYVTSMSTWGKGSKVEVNSNTF